MFNNILPSSYSPIAPNATRPDDTTLLVPGKSGISRTWQAFAAGVFLVSIPVFVQAPLVRLAPGLSLLATVGFLILSFSLLSHSRTRFWGDLLLGFTWSWFAGSIYWGWLRWEPLLHIPVEAIGVPFILYFLAQNWGKVGNLFYLGSLLGTIVTDVYFYLVDLIPYWRQLMQVEPDLAMPVFQAAIALVKTPAGISWIIVLSSVLLLTGLLPLRSQNPHWWAFSGAVLGTILVDSLFWLAASSI